MNQLLFLLSLYCLLFSQPIEHANISLLGAARQVSGSSYYIDTNTDDVLIDCGIFYPEDKSIDYVLDKEITNEKNTKLGVDATTIDAIVLTHAHLDHLGKVPLAYKRGFKGKIYSTHETFEIAEIMFENMILKSSNLGEEEFIKSDNSEKHHPHPDCKWKNKIKEPKTVKTNRVHVFHTPSFKQSEPSLHTQHTDTTYQHPSDIHTVQCGCT